MMKLSDYFCFGKAGGTPPSINKSFYNGQIPFLSISDITKNGKYILKTQRFISQSGIDNSSSWIVPKGSLVLSMYASVGLPAINTIDLATSQAMFSMILKNAQDLEFLYYYLLYFKNRKIHRYLETGTQSNINADFVKNIPVPKNDERMHVIIKTLKNLDESGYIEKKILDKLVKQKNYLLENLFI